MQTRTRTRWSEATKEQVLDLWLSGAGKVSEISKALNIPPSTTYGILYRAGVWPGHDDHVEGRKMSIKRLGNKRPQPAKDRVEVQANPAPAPEIKLPEPVRVEAGTITMIRAPRRSLWQRIVDFFA